MRTRADRRRVPARPALLWLLVSSLVICGCSIKKFAVNKLGDALAEGTATFASDDDQQLVGEALPFALKLLESLLAESPDHVGMLTASARGFVQYGYAYVQLPADEIQDLDLEQAEAGWQRARNFFRRGRDYALRGLEVKHAGFREALREDPDVAVKRVDRAQVALLYWAAAGWGGAVALSKDDPELIGDLPIIDALIERALELDEAWDFGSLHGFMVAYLPGRPGTDPAEAARLARHHFDRAVELSQGQLASPWVTLAESVALPQQDRAQFVELLEQALAIDIDRCAEWRLVNRIQQRRARRMLEQVDSLFLD